MRFIFDLKKENGTFGLKLGYCSTQDEDFTTAVSVFGKKTVKKNKPYSALHVY